MLKPLPGSQKPFGLCPVYILGPGKYHVGFP
jgi:hypothetical protein